MQFFVHWGSSLRRHTSRKPRSIFRVAWGHFSCLDRSSRLLSVLYAESQFLKPLDLPFSRKQKPPIYFLSVRQILLTSRRQQGRQTIFLTISEELTRFPSPPSFNNSRIEEKTRATGTTAEGSEKEGIHEQKGIQRTKKKHSSGYNGSILMYNAIKALALETATNRNHDRK